jgi:hypothetical protein
MVYYTNPVRAGLDQVASRGDGYTITMRWFKAYPSTSTNSIAYNLYYATSREEVFCGPPKYVSIDGALEANIIDLTPGQFYFFSVRPVEYDPLEHDLTILPIAYDNLRLYPSSILREDMDGYGTTSTSLLVKLLDVEDFPSSGVVKVGAELMEYSSVDTTNNNLVISSIENRGLSDTKIVEHQTDGYDGYVYWDTTVFYFVMDESSAHDRIFACQSRFEYPNYQYTTNDGYQQVIKDILSTDLTASDEFNETFPSYDYAGYHRTDPVQLLNGTCVGSYIGGEMYCLDGYGVGQIVRGFSLQDHNNQRQEFLLNVTGRPAVLIKRVQTGHTCSCYLATSEYPDDRCPMCYGTKFVFGYEQYYNPRRSDGRILVRPGPADENLKMTEAGLESELPLELWTLTVPTIKTRDIIILFDQDNNEEFRYEVMSATRNNTIVGLQGGQKLRVQRIRKTDPAYQIRVFRDTSMFPSKLNTTIGMVVGKIPPHTHQIVVNEGITSLTQINQTTAVAQGHNHPIIDGVVMEVLGHTHSIIL